MRLELLFSIFTVSPAEALLAPHGQRDLHVHPLVTSFSKNNQGARQLAVETGALSHLVSDSSSKGEKHLAGATELDPESKTIGSGLCGCHTCSMVMSFV